MFQHNCSNTSFDIHDNFDIIKIVLNMYCIMNKKNTEFDKSCYIGEYCYIGVSSQMPER